MSRELLQRVLKVLKVKRLRLDEHLIPIIVEEIEQELAKPEQEPVAWMYVNVDGECEQIEYGACDYDDPSITFLYTAPPRKEWVGLTDDEYDMCDEHETWRSMYNVAAKLKEKNT